MRLALVGCGNMGFAMLQGWLAAGAVTPGEVLKYDVEIMPTSTLFRKDHRIVVEISSMDVPSGGNGISANQSQPYHVCSSKTTVHKVYRGQTYPSHLLLPVIPDPIS